VRAQKGDIFVRRNKKRCDSATKDFTGELYVPQ
jgi:hypothetical protein